MIDLDYSKEELHNDYLQICEMKSSLNVKSRMLTELFSQFEDFWRVVGITPNALEQFNLSNYQRKTENRVQRAHIISRKATNEHLLERRLLYQDWLKYFWENDKTILATSSENNKVKTLKVYPIDVAKKLFVKKGFS
jgi:hypothetical protein